MRADVLAYVGHTPGICANTVRRKSEYIRSFASFEGTIALGTSDNNEMRRPSLLHDGPRIATTWMSKAISPHRRTRHNHQFSPDKEANQKGLIFM